MNSVQNTVQQCVTKYFMGVQDDVHTLTNFQNEQ